MSRRYNEGITTVMDGTADFSVRVKRSRYMLRVIAFGGQSRYEGNSAAIKASEKVNQALDRLMVTGNQIASTQTAQGVLPQGRDGLPQATCTITVIVDVTPL